MPIFVSYISREKDFGVFYEIIIGTCLHAIRVLQKEYVLTFMNFIFF